LVKRAKRLRGRRLLPSGGNLHGLDDVAEGDGPAVEMFYVALAQSLGVEEELQGVQLAHRADDRRAGRKGDAVAGVLLVEVVGLGFFAADGRSIGVMAVDRGGEGESVF